MHQSTMVWPKALVYLGVLHVYTFFTAIQSLSLVLFYLDLFVVFFYTCICALPLTCKDIFVLLYLFVMVLVKVQCSRVPGCVWSGCPLLDAAGTALVDAIASVRCLITPHVTQNHTEDAVNVSAKQQGNQLKVKGTTTALRNRANLKRSEPSRPFTDGSVLRSRPNGGALRHHDR